MRLSVFQGRGGEKREAPSPSPAGKRERERKKKNGRRLPLSLFLQRGGGKGETKGEEGEIFLPCLLPPLFGKGKNKDE